MSRLTTNKPVDEMSMLELVYNSCYAEEDGSAMYRDFETVRNARDFVRNLYKIHLNEEMPTDDDVFDESMIDELQYEPEEHLCGLIALFYRNLWAMADLREALKSYEDKEEQGLLIELPVAEGSEVFVLDYIYECKHDFECPLHDKYKCEEEIPCENQYKSYRVREAKFNFMMLAKIGETVFLTRSEAEEALARMKGENDA